MTQFTDCIAPRPFLRALNQFLTLPQLEIALAFSGRKFRCRQLPAHLVLLMVVAGFIQGKLGLPLILHWLGFGQSAADLSDQAVYQARHRIGWKPLWWLRRNLVDWLAQSRRDPTAFYRGLRLIGMDGTTLTVADTPDNDRVFGRSNNQHKKSGFPLLRVLALCELGTRVITRWMARPFRVSEQQMSLRLLRHVPPVYLRIGDRNFHNGKLWEIAKNAGFSLLLRVQSGPVFPVFERFADGSYRSQIVPRRGKNKKGRTLSVRVVECLVKVGGRTSKYRLVTNLLEATEAPACELIDQYLKRWEIETAFAEFKSQLRERTTLLRSRHPLAVLAELDGLLLGYCVVRRIALQAARQEEVDPLSISFQQTIQSIRYYVLRPTMSRKQFYRKVARRCHRRRKRRYRRCRKVVRCAWPVKKKEDQEIRFEEAEVVILNEIADP